MDPINGLTKKWIDAFIKRPTSTLLIDCTNDNESGTEIAHYICSQLAKDSHVPIVTLDAKDKKSIGIENVRFLQKSLHLKANGNGDYTRFIIVNDAGLLTTEAQNSLLKLMEELPEKTVLVVVSDNTVSMLETVKSRCFIVPVLPITEKQALEYATAAGHSDTDVRKVYLLSEGYATGFKRILSGEQDTIIELVELAKKFISDSVFDRQLFLQSLASTKSMYTYSEFMHAIKLTAKSGMRFATSQDKKTKWKNILQAAVLADEQVERNVSEKLALLSLSVAI